MFPTNIVEKIKTHILCSVMLPPPENRAVYDIMWKNNVERGRPQMTIWCMRNACLIPKAKNTHSGCVILNAFPQPQCLHERATVSLYTYIVCPVGLGVVFSNGDGRQNTSEYSLTI